MPSSKTHNLAEKIARILERESQTADLSAIQASIGDINARLDGIESELQHYASRLASARVSHPSNDRFSVAEAVADENAKLNKEKACTFEPNGKPCDHCSMCSSRGF